MNIMNRLTWKSMVKNRTRTIVTAIGIALSAALFCAVTTMGASILSYLIDLQIAVGGDYHVSAVTLTQEEAHAIRNREDVASFAETQTLGVVNFYGEEMGFNSGLVKACNEAYFDNMPTVLKEGRLPQNSGEFVIGEYLLHNMEAKGYPTAIGSEVTLTVTPYVASMAQGDPEGPTFTITGTIVGIHDMNSSVIAPGDAGEFSYIFTCLEENTPAPLYCDLFLKAESPYKATGLAAAIRGNANYSLLQYYGVVEAGNVTIIIGAIMAVIIAIVMVGTVSLISNAFSISVAQRTQEFGLLSSVGATKKQLRRSVRFEAGMLCLLGIPAGLALGFGAMAILLNIAGDTVEGMVANQLSGVQIKAVADPIALLGAALITSAAVFLSAWRPSARAAKVTPMMAIRQETEYRADKKLAKTARKWWRPGKVSANMASKYYRTNRKKYRSIVFALGISVVLFLSTTAVSGSLQYMADSYYDTENYDFRVGLVDNVNGEEIFNQIRSHQSVAQSVMVEDDWFYFLIPKDAASQQRQDAMPSTTPVEITEAWRQNPGFIYYLEDDTFRAFMQEQGIDPDPYFDKENPIAAVFYQKYETMTTSENGGKKSYTATFPPLGDSITKLSYMPSTPDVYEWVAQQVEAMGYEEVISDERGFEMLADGRILYWTTARGCAAVYHPGGMIELTNESEPYKFTFLAVEETDANGDPILRYYTYNTETGAVGNEVMGETAGTQGTIGIGAQVSELPFGVPSSAQDSSRLCMLRPLSMLDQTWGLTGLYLRTNNYLATKNYLDTLAEETELVYYSDYLSESYQMRQVSKLINLFAYGFVVIMTLISVANIFNIVSTNILLRRKDISMLRSLGMSSRKIAEMTVREYAMCGFRALCWSLPIGLFADYLLKRLLAMAMTLEYGFPWASFGIIVGCVVLVIGSSVAYALTRIRKDNPIDAIRMENT